MYDALESFLLTYVDIRLLLAIVLLSAWNKKYLKGLFPKILMAYKVIVLAFVLSVIFYAAILEPEKGAAMAGLICLITYLAATNFYNLFYAPIENKIKSFFESLDKPQ